MNLTRRDAIAALAGAGVVTGSGAAAFARRVDDADESEPPSSPDATLDTLVATAEVVYPSTVEGIQPFVETYSLGRIEGRDSYREGVGEAAAQLDTHATLWFDADSFSALSPAERDDLLHEMGVHTAEAQPDGTIAERVRFYVVNDLLYALYTSPTGGELVGIENPQGYPGGTESYREGPP